MSVLKGNDIGLRDAIGNVCAPWLLLPFLASVFAKRHRPLQAAMVGFMASLCALAGFYFANSFVLDLGSHTWMVDVSLTLRSGWFYFVLSILSGPCLGLLGAWHIRRKPLTPALLVALLFVLEPFTWKIYDFGGFSAYPILSVIETTIGILACIVLIIRFKLARPL